MASNIYISLIRVLRDFSLCKLTKNQYDWMKLFVLPVGTPEAWLTQSAAGRKVK